MKRVIGVCLLATLSACAPPGDATTPLARGISPAETPISKRYVQIISVSPRSVEVDASGRNVLAPAPRGYCVPKDGVMSASHSLFFVMEKCGGEAPGLLSLSIADSPISDESGPRASLDGLKALLETENGRTVLGFDAGSGAAFLDKAEIRGSTLYVVVTDNGSSGLSFAGKHLIRAFTEINERMVIVTLISERDDPSSGDELLERTAEIVRAIRAANTDASLS